MLSVCGTENPDAAEAKKAWCRDRLVQSSTGEPKSGAGAGQALWRGATLVESNPSKAGAILQFLLSLPCRRSSRRGPASRRWMRCRPCQWLPQGACAGACHNWTFLHCALSNVSSNVALPMADTRQQRSKQAELHPLFSNAGFDLLFCLTE